MKKQITVIILALALIASLAACGGKIKQGEVIDKAFTPAHSQLRIMPMCIYNGKTTTVIPIPYNVYYADKWEIKIQQYSKDENKTLYATYRVTEDVYNSVSIGAEFVYDRDYTPDTPEYTRERAD